MGVLIKSKINLQHAKSLYTCVRFAQRTNFICILDISYKYGYLMLDMRIVVYLRDFLFHCEHQKNKKKTIL